MLFGKLLNFMLVAWHPGVLLECSVRYVFLSSCASLVPIFDNSVIQQYYFFSPLRWALISWFTRLFNPDVFYLSLGEILRTFEEFFLTCMPVCWLLFLPAASPKPRADLSSILYDGRHRVPWAELILVPFMGHPTKRTEFYVLCIFGIFWRILMELDVDHLCRFCSLWKDRCAVDMDVWAIFRVLGQLWRSWYSEISFYY